MIVFSSVLLTMYIFGAAMQNQQQSKAMEDAHVGLPWVPDSRSELLSATHVFAISPLTLLATAWSKGPDQLEHRQVTVQATLLQAFKGTLDVNKGAEFTFSVQQTRESAFVESDYHGVWSHTDLAPQTQYLIIATGASNSVVDLLREEQCKAVLNQIYLADARMALEGERVYQAVRKTAGSGFNAEHALLVFAKDQDANVHDVFARYLWARAQPAFLQAEAVLLPPVLALVDDERGTILFRGELIADIYEAVLLLQPDLELTKTVVRAFFALLQQESAAPLRAHLVEVELYNLTVREGNANLPVEAVFPDRAERDICRGILSHFNSERARQIENWLNR